MDAKSAAKTFFHLLSEEIPAVALWLPDRVFLSPPNLVSQKEIDLQKPAPEFCGGKNHHSIPFHILAASDDRTFFTGHGT